MLNVIWGFMMIIGIVVAAFTGNITAVNNSIIESSKEAISLCIFMLGIVGMWTGIMAIAEKAGIIDKLSQLLHPFIRWIFPSIPPGHKANAYIATNIAANIFGLGWASTPSGLMAIKELSKLNNNSKKASHDMCALLILNISSLQLIPVNMIAYRSQYGSVMPSKIVAPSLIATMISTIVAIIFIKIARRGE